MKKEEGKETGTKSLDTGTQPLDTGTEKTPTSEEQLAAIQTQLGEAQEKLEQTEKGLRTAHQTLTDKDKQLKQLEGDRADYSALSAKVEVLGGMVSDYMEKGEAYSEETPPKPKVDYSKRFQEIEASARVKSQIEPRQRRAQALGLPMDDPKILLVEYLASSGRWADADKALDDLEVNKEEKVETPKETEDERVERLADEKYRQKLEEDGKLVTETPGLSFASRDIMETIKRYSEGDPSVSRADYEKAINKIT